MKKHLRKFWLILTVAILLLSQSPQLIYALSPDQRKVFDSGIFLYDTNASDAVTSCTSYSTMPGDDSVAKAFNYFTSAPHSLSPNAAAGIIGNLLAESGLVADRQQGDKSVQQTPIPNSGFGIAQWTTSGRQQNLVNFAKDHDLPVTDLGLQLDFLWHELTTVSDYASAYKALQTTTSVEDAMNQFLGPLDAGTKQPVSPTAEVARTGGFENAGTPHAAVRLSKARETLAKANKSGSTTTSTSQSGGAGKTVVLDPGHGPNFSEVDTETKLNMVESANTPEINEVWDVTQKIKTQLETDGYKVLLTKNDVEGSGVTFRDRANVANNANAAIAVSIHDDHGPSYSAFKDIYAQEVGGYRGAGSNKTEFEDTAVAKVSQQYAEIFKNERQKTEGGTVNITVNTSFNTRKDLEPGNLSMVQLFSKVPWVYNEVGANGGLSDEQKTQYANGITNGIEKSIGPGAPGSGSSSYGCGSTASANSGDIVSIALAEVGTTDIPNNLGESCKYQGSTCGQAWCADFVSWVYKEAGTPFTGGWDGGWRLPAVQGVREWLQKNGTWIDNPGTPVPVDDPRAPKPGDVVTYGSGDDHTNIVVSYDGKNVTIVGGNQEGGVTTYVRDVFGSARGWGRMK